MNGLKVNQPGILSLIQDSGRFGQHHIGLTVGGPMDRDSFQWANLLCKNPENTPIIEITLGGLVLTAEVDSYIAVTGAQADIKINNQSVNAWTLHKIQPGDQIALGFFTLGTRCYLAVPGGFKVPPVFNSSSTVCREAIGGLDGHGRALTSGDLLPCDNHTHMPAFYLPVNSQPLHLQKIQSVTTLRVILGYQEDYFSHQQKQLFFSAIYEISELNDRMGFRLTGPAIAPSIDGILSEGICLGAIQVPANGQPIVLLNDRQTIGGYPKLGSVLSLDISKLTQLSATNKVSFEPISIEEAHNLLHLKNMQNLRSQRQINHNKLSEDIENLLVSRNLRGMQSVSAYLDKGSYLRAARLIHQCAAEGTVLIGTGFPVNGSFETDGPVGAIALYEAIEKLGGHPIIVCDRPLFNALDGHFNTHEILFDNDISEEIIDIHNPSLIIAIERPGQAGNGCYYNMRGVDISSKCANFDSIMRKSSCPTIAIGDGGNEIGMGNSPHALEELNIQASTTPCDELLVADVSNWAAHGIIALLSVLTNKDLLKNWDNTAVLQFLSNNGSVDGLTGENTLSEDGLPSSESQLLVQTLRQMTGHDDSV
jgi:biotin-dependent carboxylase-like uncharacterized protein